MIDTRAKRLGLTAAAVLLAGAAGPARAQDALTLRQRALFRLVGPLGSVPLLDPTNEYLGPDRQAVQRLGKALFWDEQLGSDGQACASCHFHAGADNRSKNQINPGFRNQTPQFPSGDSAFGGKFGPNYQLSLTDFPIQTNDVVSSQGVFAATFTGIGFPADRGTAEPGNAMDGTGKVFSVGGALVRSVPPRNTPSAVNAAYNRRNFWDSRARDEFNGASPIGDLDCSGNAVACAPKAQVVKVVSGVPQLVALSVAGSSTASQAVGPPLSDLEMSYHGRAYTDLGRKMLSPALRPLAQQLVAPDDSLLGFYSAQQAAPGVKGLSNSVGYADLVKQAFPPQWWDAPGCVDVSGATPRIDAAGTPGPKCFTVMEYNFSFFFGFAVSEYEKTLRATDTPFDRFLMGDETALGLKERDGLEIFLGRGRCVECHSTPLLSNASIAAQDTVSQQTDQLIPPHNVERMIIGSPCAPEAQHNGTCDLAPASDPVIAVYDAGFYNIGVRPTLEDVGIGATIGGSNLPLSFSQRYLDCVKAKAPVTAPDVLQANLDCGIPHIAARPIEAATVLLRAWQLANGSTPVKLPVAGSCDSLHPDACIAQAQALLTGQPATATAFAQAAANLVVARDALQAGVANIIDPPPPAPSTKARVTKLLAGATSLMPDPQNPGPDPLNYYAPPLLPTERTNVLGAFKVPGLRNVELTAPYFHNGGQATLNQVVQFYDRGGDFPTVNCPTPETCNLDPNIAPIGLLDFEEDDLVAFLKALTDDRVKYERAPFDHPSLSLPNGGTPGNGYLFGSVPFLDDRFELPAVGRGGSPIPLGTPGTPFANFPDAVWSRMTVESGDDQTAAPGAALDKTLAVRITDAYGNPVAGFPVAFSAPAGGTVSPVETTTGPDGIATATATLAATAGDQTFTVSAFTVLDAPRKFVAHALTASSPPSGGSPGPVATVAASHSGGGCASAPADAATALLVAAAALLRRRRR